MAEGVDDSTNDSTEYEPESNIRHFKIDSAKIPVMPFKIELPSARVPENTDYFNKMAQDAANAIKGAASFSHALAISQDFIKEIKLPTNGVANTNAKKLSDTTTGLAGSAASIADSMASITYPIQPQVYDTLKRATKGIVDSIAATLTPSLQKNLREIGGIYQKYTSRLKQTKWPLYLVADDDLYHEVMALEDTLDQESMRIEIKHIAERHLDRKWVANIKNDWSTISLVDEGARAMLIRALENHERKHYIEATSILMCLFNSFYENFSSESLDLTDQEQAILDSLAIRYIPEQKEDEKVDPKNPHSKERVLLMSFINEDGWFLWEGITSYIIGTTLICNAKPDVLDDILEHNPTRNKICHGIQTQFDTWEHSVKAILVTDAILELNALTQSTGRISKKGQ